jgi:hypothetical protein
MRKLLNSLVRFPLNEPPSSSGVEKFSEVEVMETENLKYVLRQMQIRNGGQF